MKVTLFSLFIALLMVGWVESSQPSESVNMNDTAPKKHAIETAVEWSKLEVRNGIRYLQNEETPFTGRAKEFYFNGQKSGEVSFKDGKGNGLATTWYENGQKKREGNFKDDKPDGLATEWYENGQKKSEVNYKDGKENGVWTSWHENGQKSSEVNFKDGKQNGLYTSWHENGQQSTEVNCKDGKLDGLETRWYENGQKAGEANYKDGKEDGLETSWYENGQKKEEENWKDGKLMSAVVWKPNGEKCPVTNVKDGNGVLVWYNDYNEDNEVFTDLIKAGILEIEKTRLTYKDGRRIYPELSPASQQDASEPNQGGSRVSKENKPDVVKLIPQDAKERNQGGHVAIEDLNWTAKVSESEAFFEFPPTRQKKWKWDRKETPENSLEYKWGVWVGDPESGYEFGPLLFKGGSDSEDVTGSLALLIKVCQNDLWQVTAEGGNNLREYGSASVSGGKVQLKITDPIILKKLFVSKPDFVRMVIVTPEFQVGKKIFISYQKESRDKNYAEGRNRVSSGSKPDVAKLSPQDVFGGKFHEVKRKLEKDADPDAILLPKGKRTALHCCCMEGRVNIVKLLLAKGANPNALDKYNMTPLDILFSPDFEGRAPLERMSAQNQLEIQRMLEKAGGKRNRLPSKELFKGKYMTDTAPKKDSASSKSVSAAEPNRLPEKLSPDAARQFLSEDIGRWKVNVTERTKDNPPINYEYVMAVRWEKKGEVSRWEFSPMINGERVPIKGFKKYDFKEGVFIWRAQREGFPDMVERQIYDKSTNTLNSEVTYPNGAKGKTTWLKAGKDEWRGNLIIIEEGKVVVRVEFISKRITEVTPNP